MGPLLLVQAGVHLVDLPDDALFDALHDGEPIEVAGGEIHARGARRRARARVQEPDDVLAATDAPPARDRRGARGVRPQHRRAHGRGARAAVGQDRAAALRHRLPRPRRARSSSAASATSATSPRCGPTSATCKPVLVGVDGGADAILDAGFQPDMIVGDMDSATERDAAQRRRARRARLSRRPRAGARAPRAPRARAQGRPGARHQPGHRDAHRPREGRAADRLGRLAVQPRRVPRQEPPRACPRPSSRACAWARSSSTPRA